MKNADYIIRGDYVLPMDKGQAVIKDGAVVVKGNKITEVGSFGDISKKYYSKNITGGKNRAVLPGLINTHTHAAMVYFRGMADDLPLKEWLEKHIWPAENKWLSPEFVSDATELACLEMIKAGITTYSDMYFFEDASGKAAKKIGMRAVLGAGIVDFPTISGKNADEYLGKAEKFIEKWKKDKLVTPCIAPHSVYACGPDTLKKIKKIADKYNVPIHIHVSEAKWEVDEIEKKYGRRPVEHLENLGFLDSCMVAAHCVWVNDKEIEALAKHKVGVSHCIESNLKLGSGIAPVPAMLRAGIRVAFGTDGAASNNDLNILSEMSTAAKVHKAVSGDPTVLDAKTALLMATRWGAEVLGLGKITGSLEKGKSADIIIMDLDKPHLTPLYDIYSHIVYSSMASDVETVFVNGKLVVDKRKLCTADEKGIISKARTWSRKIR
ncbi:MAG: 5-methylthioadenosine/S-adenosylhomocysteine deaminase [Nitrospirae bacterium]|nr:MAG: 5-methylthioadenosine/S-adenosylhomocysteine deaminase [Nitrospirota bacterium]